MSVAGQLQLWAAWCVVWGMQYAWAMNAPRDSSWSRVTRAMFVWPALTLLLRIAAGADR